MDLSLSGKISIFGGVCFIFKPLLGIERQKKLKKNSFLTRKPRSHVRILIYTVSNVAKRGVMFVHITFFVVKYFFFNSSPCSYHGLFYGHAMFIGNSQKEARYLSFPVFIAVRFIASKV